MTTFRAAALEQKGIATFYGYATKVPNLAFAPTGDGVGTAGRAGAAGGALLDFLFRHQERAEYLHAQHWTEGDVRMWDNIGTVHNAVADSLADEPRFMRRMQVMATRDYAALAA